MISSELGKKQCLKVEFKGFEASFVMHDNDV